LNTESSDGRTDQSSQIAQRVLELALNLSEKIALSINREISNESQNGLAETRAAVVDVRNGNSNFATISGISVIGISVVGVGVGVVGVVSVGVVVAGVGIASCVFNQATDSELQAAEIRAGFTCSTSDLKDVGADSGEGIIDGVECADDSGELSSIADNLEHLLESSHALTDLLNSVDRLDNITTETVGTCAEGVNGISVGVTVHELATRHIWAERWSGDTGTISAVVGLSSRSDREYSLSGAAVIVVSIVVVSIVVVSIVVNGLYVVNARAVYGIVSIVVVLLCCLVAGLCCELRCAKGDEGKKG